MDGYSKLSHVTYRCEYHFVLVPKYRCHVRLINPDPAAGEVHDVMSITRRDAERICRAAFELASRWRKRCTLVDKTSVLPSMVFSRSVFDGVAREYPNVEVNPLPFMNATPLCAASDSGPRKGIRFPRHALHFCVKPC